MSFTKISDFNNLTIEEIQNEINKLKIEVLHLKIKKVTRQDIKPHTFKHKRHNIAQLSTLKTQKIKREA